MLGFMWVGGGSADLGDDVGCCQGVGTDFADGAILARMAFSTTCPCRSWRSISSSAVTPGWEQGQLT